MYVCTINRKKRRESGLGSKRARATRFLQGSGRERRQTRAWVEDGLIDYIEKAKR